MNPRAASGTTVFVNSAAMVRKDNPCFFRLLRIGAVARLAPKRRITN
jgi:hypothetical protein